MDEPFAALDEFTRCKPTSTCGSVAGPRITVVFAASVFESVFLSTRIVVMAARPGRVFRELAVEAPFPRNETFRTSPAYAALCRRTSEVLAGAINSTAGAGHGGH